MAFIDILALIILAVFVWKGVKLGLIEAVGGIIGLFIGAFAAGRYYPQGAAMIGKLTFGHEILANIIAFLLIFAIINRAVALIFWVVGRIFNLVAIIPFLKSFNYFLGGLFGVLEGFIFLGIILWFIHLWPMTAFWQDKIDQAKIYPWLEKIGALVSPLLPERVDIPVSLGNIPQMSDLQKITDPVKNLINSTIKK
jgi:uncharacterized membrane protein required for colicin V production